MDRKDLSEESVAEVTWEENVRWKEERAQNSALREAGISGQIKMDQDEPDKETGGMAREARESSEHGICWLLALYQAACYVHLHSLS